MHVSHIVIKTLGVCWLSCTVKRKRTEVTEKCARRNEAWVEGCAQRRRRPRRGRRALKSQETLSRSQSWIRDGQEAETRFKGQADKLNLILLDFKGIHGVLFSPASVDAAVFLNCLLLAEYLQTSVFWPPLLQLDREEHLKYAEVSPSLHLESDSRKKNVSHLFSLSSYLNSLHLRGSIDFLRNNIWVCFFFFRAVNFSQQSLHETLHSCKTLGFKRGSSIMFFPNCETVKQKCFALFCSLFRLVLAVWAALLSDLFWPLSKNVSYLCHSSLENVPIFWGWVGG